MLNNGNLSQIIEVGNLQPVEREEINLIPRAISSFKTADRRNPWLFTPRIVEYFVT